MKKFVIGLFILSSISTFADTCVVTLNPKGTRDTADCSSNPFGWSEVPQGAELLNDLLKKGYKIQTSTAVGNSVQYILVK